MDDKKTNWQEVPAWQALKALTEGTHDVEVNDDGRWFKAPSRYDFSSDDRCRIRPKRRTMDVKGLPAFNFAVLANKSKYVAMTSVVVDFQNEEMAREALRILEAAREAQ